MTDKREVELPELENYFGSTVDGANSNAWKNPNRLSHSEHIAVRERQLLAALTKISQLEQQILEIQGNAAIRFAEAEARWHKAEEELRVKDAEILRLNKAVVSIFSDMRKEVYKAQDRIRVEWGLD